MDPRLLANAPWLAMLPSHFKIQGLLGRGAFGEVYEADDSRRNQRVAVKVLTVPLNPNVLRRFHREAEILRGLQHPHIMNILDQGTAGEIPYLVLELLEGDSLERPPPKVDPLELMLPIAAALEHLHAQGVIHRDIKPGNIIWTSDRRPVLVDFGLVSHPDATKLTETGAVVGSLGYMSPELLQGQGYGPHSDWWAWAVTLYELCELRLPFGSNDLHGAMAGQPLPLPAFQRYGSQDRERLLLEEYFRNPAAGRPTTEAAIVEVLGGTVGPRTSASQSVKLAAVPSVRVDGAAPATEAPHRARRLRGGLAALALVGLAVGILLPGGKSAEPSHESGAASEPDVASSHRFGPTYVHRVFQEFDALNECTAPSERTWTLCRDRDPRRWGLILDQLPTVRQFEDFVVGGGRPETLPKEVLTGIRQANQRFQKRGFPEPFAPWSEPGPVKLEDAEQERLLLELGESVRTRDFPHPLSPWLGTAVKAAVDVCQARETLQEPGQLPGPTDDIQGSAFPAAMNVESRLGLFYSRRQYRVRVAGVMAQGNASLRRMLYALGRALKKPQADPEHLAICAQRMVKFGDLFWYSALAFESPRRLLGLEPEKANQFLVQGQVISQLVRPRRVAGDTKGVGQLRRTGVESFRAAGAEASSETRWVKRRRKQAARQLERFSRHKEN